MIKTHHQINDQNWQFCQTRVGSSKDCNVVSLFNGMNTGRQALKNQGFKIGKYYSSEIKPYAIELTQYHFPDTIQVGDVTKWRDWNINWKSIDLVLSGSPCQDLSIAGNRKGINGNKSSLFFVFVEILNHIKSLNPNVIFFQENVGSASKLDIGIMSRELGIYPVRINSELLTAQKRDRYYWTNIRTKKTMFDLVTDIPEPKDKGILLQDIIENGFVLKNKANALLESEAKTFGYKDMEKFKNMFIKRTEEKRMNPNVVYSFVDRKKARALLESEARPLKDKEKLFNRYKTTGFGTIIYELKNNTLDVRILTKKELCLLQGFPEDYCNILSRNKAASLLGDGWTLPIVEHFFSYLRFS